MDVECYGSRRSQKTETHVVEHGRKHNLRTQAPKPPPAQRHSRCGATPPCAIMRHQPTMGGDASPPSLRSARGSSFIAQENPGRSQHRRIQVVERTAPPRPTSWWQQAAGVEITPRPTLLCHEVLEHVARLARSRAIGIFPQVDLPTWQRPPFPVVPVQAQLRACAVV